MSTTPFSSTTIADFSASLPSLDQDSKRIFLLRHGETDWNRMGKIQGGGFDIELNEDGLKQADAVAELLRGVPLDLVASSHLQRARVTADVLYSFHKSSATRVVDKKFGEMRFGDAEGVAIRGPLANPIKKNEFFRQVKVMREDRCIKWPGLNGESIEDVENRACSALQSLIDQHPNVSQLAVVAHGRTNKIMLQALLHLSDSEYDSLNQGNTCVNVLDLDPEGKYSARVLNYSDHVDSETARKAPS